VHNGSALDPLLTIFLITDSLPSFLEAFIGHGGYKMLQEHLRLNEEEACNIAL
jgi:hypothetical protein